jgi:peroxiredoxin
MGVAVLVSRLVLAVLFVVAGWSKLLDRAGTRRAVGDFGVPPVLVGPVAVGLPIVELVVGVGMVPALTAGWSAIGAITLLVVFISAIGVSLARGRRPQCRCFGQVHSSAVGATTLVRNVALAAVAAIVLGGVVTGRNPELATLAAGVPGTGWLVAAVGAVLIAVVVIEGWFIVNLMRQQGRLLLRLDALEAAGPAHRHHLGQPEPGLAAGSVAPEFGLSRLNGETMTLKALRSEKRPVLLVFSDPACGPCSALMPEIAGWQDRHADAVTIAILSSGDRAANESKASEAGVRRVLLDTDSRIATEYQYVGTPSAVLVDPGGRIASPIAAGVDAISALVARTVTAAQPQSPPALARPSYVHIGRPAPEFVLADTTGRSVALRDLNGTRVLLLFWNPGCGFCAQMLDDLRAWETSALPEAPQLVVISTGTATENKEMGLRAPVLADPSNTLAPTFGVNGTPMAVMIDTEGRVASEPAAGADTLCSRWAETSSPSQPTAKPNTESRRVRDRLGCTLI